MQWFTSIINLQFNLATKTNRKDSLKIMLCIKSVGFPGGASGEEPTCQCRRHRRCGFSACVGKIPWRRAWQPTPVFLPGEFFAQRSLAGYSPQGRKDSDMTKATQHTCTEANSWKTQRTGYLENATVISVSKAPQTPFYSDLTINAPCLLCLVELLVILCEALVWRYSMDVW